MIHRRKLVTLGFMAVTLAFMGCDGDGAGLGDPLIETADFLQVAHHGDVLFLSRTEPENLVMDALFEGTVTLDEAGCIRLETTADYGVTAVWPHGYTLEQESGSFRVLDEAGQAVGTLGDEFSLGGGEVDQLHEGIGFTPEDQQLANDRCEGKFWIVADVL